jgi:hypothetical protein
MSDEIEAAIADIKSAIPPEAYCQLPIPHPPHRHEITWGDLVGGYWCDGSSDA